MISLPPPPEALARVALLRDLEARLKRAVFEDERTQPRDLSALVARLLQVSAELAEAELAETREGVASGDDAARAERRRTFEKHHGGVA